MIFLRLHDDICKSPDFLNIRILKLFVYSQRPKTERSDFKQCWNPNDQLFGMVLFGFWTFGTKAILFGIRTFGFQSFGDLVPIVWNPNVQISDSWDQKVPTVWNQTFRLFHRILILLTLKVEIYDSDFCLLSLVFPSRQTNKCK